MRHWAHSLASMLFVLLTVYSKQVFAAAEGACSAKPTGLSADFNPNNPAASGYGLVFDEEFNSFSSVDFSTTPREGYNFYTANIIGCAPRGGKPKSIFSISSDGALRDEGYEAGCGYDLSSAGFRKDRIGKLGRWSNNWVGHVFGQGAYFESRIKWKPKLDTGKGFAHVAWWATAAEMMFQNGALNLPQGFPHMNWVEVDFLENDGSEKTYSAGALNFCDKCGKEKFKAFGNDEQSHSGPSMFSNNTITLPFGDSFEKYHVFGTLWLYGGPAGGGGKGMIINYLDGKPTKSQIYWYNSYRFDSLQNNPPTGYNIFSVLDQEHLAVILGTGPSAPIEVDWVHVWQLPKAAEASGNSYIEPQPGFSGGTGSCAEDRP